MKEIMFRVFCKTEGTFIDQKEVATSWMIFGDGSLYYVDGESFVPASRTFEYQFFVGLKDKNHKDIYDGDIIKYLGAFKFEILIVEYKKDGFHLPRSRYTFDIDPSIEVIGNIYENPELLDEKNV